MCSVPAARPAPECVCSNPAARAAAPETAALAHTPDTRPTPSSFQPPTSHRQAATCRTSSRKTASSRCGTARAPPPAAAHKRPSCTCSGLGGCMPPLNAAALHAAALRRSTPLKPRMRAPYAMQRILSKKPPRKCQTTRQHAQRVDPPLTHPHPHPPHHHRQLRLGPQRAEAGAARGGGVLCRWRQQHPLHRGAGALPAAAARG